jgi:predicted CoA-binding protein
MNEAIKTFIESKDIAIMGASARKKKFGNAIYKELKNRGYNVYPVHLTADIIESDKAYRTIDELPEEVSAACVCMKPENAAGVTDKLINSRINKIWFQQGADFSEQVNQLEAAGKTVITGKCLLLYAPPVGGIHAVHRFLAKLFGKY